MVGYLESSLGTKYGIKYVVSVNKNLGLSHLDILEEFILQVNLFMIEGLYSLYVCLVSAILKSGDVCMHVFACDGTHMLMRKMLFIL